MAFIIVYLMPQMCKTMKVDPSLVITTLIISLASILTSCQEDENPGPAVIITGFSPNSGLIGQYVTIYGNNFIPEGSPEVGVGIFTNTSTVKFNGTIAEAEYVYQDSISRQRINTIVPPGTTSGLITVSANGVTASSASDFTITIPDYIPDVTVSTVVDKVYSIDVAIDSNGNYYLATHDNFKILKITSDGVVIILLDVSSDPEPQYPLGIAVDNNGNVYTTVGQEIKRIAPDGAVSTIAGSKSFGYKDGQGANAQFYFPWGIDVDENGNLYVADLLNFRIRKITPDRTVSTLAGSTFGYSDGQGSDAQFSVPIDVALDVNGNVYVVEGGNISKIRKVTPGGVVTTIAGSTAGYLDGPGISAQFNDPRGIAVDASGNIYIGDQTNYVIRRISSDGNVATVAGSTYGFSDGPGSSALFQVPKGITLDMEGNLYVSDSYNYKIRKIVID